MTNSPFLAEDAIYMQGYTRGTFAAEYQVAFFCKDTNPYYVTQLDGITYSINEEKATKWDLGWDHGYREHK